jgi:putative glutamine amidotransferase
MPQSSPWTFNILNMSRLPLIAIPADRRLYGKHYFHMVGEKYIEAVAQGANAVPVLVPALGSEIDLPSLLDACDGLLLTGSASNVEPHHYGGPASEPGTLHDSNRDATTLPLIARAVAAGLPVLAICRGFQEMNVAYGGTLNPKVHEVPGNLDHRDDESLPLDVQYAPAHEVLLEPGGQLQKIAGADRLRVNSLHSQGVERLGTDLIVEARAPDGVIEAFRVADSPTFALGLQWHPEWQFAKDPFSRALFAAFGRATRQRAIASR